MMQVKYILFMCAAVFLDAACATNAPAPGVQTTPVGTMNYNYRADMTLTVPGHAPFEGMAVTKLSGPLNITIQSPVALDRLQITSCARQDVFEGVKSPFGYQYVPVAQETAGLCPLYIEAYSKSTLTSWGFVAFRNDETLSAHIDCNGEGWTYAGVSVCQTKNGLEQRLTFPQKIAHFEAEAGCHAVTSDNQSFVLTPAKGFCRATFAAVVNGQTLWHRLILLAYDQVLVR